MKKIGTLFCILIQFYSFAQQPAIESDSVKQLLNERAVLLGKNSPTQSIDLKLFQQGYLPPAIVYTKNIPEGNQINFSLFRDYTKLNTSNIESRLKMMFPNLVSSNIDYQGKSCYLTFSPTLTNEDLDKLVKIFSYNGFTTKN